MAILLILEVQVLALVLTAILPDRDNNVLDKNYNKDKVEVLILVLLIMEVKTNRDNRDKEKDSKEEPLRGKKWYYQKAIL